MVKIDLYGEKPANTKGKYFRNSIWWWKPLWKYTTSVANSVLASSDCEGGHFNDGHLIDDAKARGIAAILKRKLELGECKIYSEDYQKQLDAMPEIPCDLCGAPAVGNEPIVQRTCMRCDGKGKRRPSETWYRFGVENVEEFAEFCENSGGFRFFLI